jgi:hypothetical protein
MIWRRRKDRAERDRADDESRALERLENILTWAKVQDGDPDEVEARIRNLSHGTYRE